MILYPKHYCKKITDLNIDFLKENNIKALILDVDNTLIDYDRNFLEGLEEWHTNIKNAGIKTIILSNSNKVDKVRNVANTLGIEYIYFGTKPLKRGFKKAIAKLDLPVNNIAAVGDQIFTDVIGANRCKIFPILVEPINEKDLLVTKWKRPIEEKIKNNYLKKQMRK